MYGLDIRLSPDSSFAPWPMPDGGAHTALIHVDCAVQVDESQLERLASDAPSPLAERASSSSPAACAASSSTADDAELLAVAHSRQSLTAGAGGSSSSGAHRSSPFPRSDGPSPFWPVDEDASADDEAERPDEAAESADADGAPRSLELQEATFVSGHPHGERRQTGREENLLVSSSRSPLDLRSTSPSISPRPPLHLAGELSVGSIGFYRFDEPGGVHGLRPPPLRSNLICLMAIPRPHTWCTPTPCTFHSVHC